ncbi:hypothetical protein KAH27_02575 [bacterium]|nr:hypothetical protein [bacterium]
MMSETQNTDNLNNTKNNSLGTNDRLLKVLFWLLMVGFSFLRINHILSAGLTTSEADVLTRFGAILPLTFSNLFSGVSWNEPLIAIIMRLSFLCGEPPVYGRYVFAAFGIWSLLLIAGIARRNNNLFAGLIASIIAGFSATLITSSQEISKISLIIWAALIVQWAFSLLRNTPKQKNVIIYLILALMGLLISPLVSLVVFAHLIWFVIFSIRERSNDKLVSKVFRITAIGGLLIAAPFFILQWIAYGKIHLMLLFGPSFFTNLLMDISCDIAKTDLQPALFIIFSLAILITVVHSIIKKKGEARVWGTVIFITFIMWLFSPYKSMRPANSSFLLPFVILLVIQCFIEIAGMTAKLRGYLGAIIKCCFAVLVIATIVVWGFGQYKFYQKKLQNKIVRDLSGASAFLRKTVKQNDRILFVSDSDMYDSLRTRYYLYNYLTKEAKNSYESICLTEWLANSLSYSPDANSSLWLIGNYKSGKIFSQTAYKHLTFPFTVPVVNVIHTSKWNNFVSLNLLRDANSTAPGNPLLADQLLNWYKESSGVDLQKCIADGVAGEDIACVGGSKQNKKKAANCVLYSLKDYSITNFYKFDKFINITRDFGIDNERAVYYYRLFAENALKNTNLIIAVNAVESAQKIDPQNPSLYRLEAKIESSKKTNDFNKIVDLNKCAAEEYQKRYGKRFIGAQYATAIAYQALSNYTAALGSCHDVLSYYTDELKMPVSIQTDYTENGRIIRKKWNENQLAWIGRCNSLISSLLNATGDYENAILWETKNLDEHNSEARRNTSRERLAKMYTRAGGLDKAFQYLTSLANSATTISKRISWKIEGAQLYVTIGDTVSTYDRWEDLQKEIEKLPMEERWEWSKDKRYQRILRYLSSRSQMDIRNPVIASLEKRAGSETNTTLAARLYAQVAEIYKCKLQYNKTEKMFGLARKTAPLYFDAYLADGLLQYRLKRYAKAENVFTNMTALIDVSNTVNQIIQDWRYIILNMLVKKGIPPSLEKVLSEIGEVKPYLNDVSEYYNYYGNVLECYGKFDLATNQFTLGIQTNKLNLQNYLDLGYLICKHSDSDKAGKMIDSIMSLDLPEGEKRLLETDWRFIILHHTSVRPYNLKE